MIYDLEKCLHFGEVFQSVAIRLMSELQTLKFFTRSVAISEKRVIIWGQVHRCIFQHRFYRRSFPTNIEFPLTFQSGAHLHWKNGPFWIDEGRANKRCFYSTHWSKNQLFYPCQFDIFLPVLTWHFSLINMTFQTQFDLTILIHPNLAFSAVLISGI